MKESFKGQLQDLKKIQKRHKKQQEKAKTRFVKNHQAPHASLNEIKNKVSNEDKQLFLSSIRGVQPLVDDNRLEHKAQILSHPEYYQKKREQAEGQNTTNIPEIKAKKTSKQHSQQINPDDNSYINDTAAKDIPKKLRKGFWTIEATLDLHGSNLEQASQRFDRFLSSCIQHQIRCVCIIHGQGHGSKNNQSILKDSVKSWLRGIPQVRSYITAPQNMGGEGAVLVLLSKA